MDKKLSRAELIERLKAISQEEVPEMRQRHMGAMCYCPAPMGPITRMLTFPRIVTIPRKRIIRCNKCHKYLFDDWSRKEIQKSVKSMARMGYDVKVKTLCKKCCNNLKEELYPGIGEELIIDEEHTIDISLNKRNYVFHFREDRKRSYHLAIANDSQYYEYVLAFLQGKSSFRNEFDRDYFLAENVHIIEYMTGLKINE